MTEERITKTQDEQGNTHTTHVVSDSGGGSAKWVVLLLIVALVAVGAYFLTQTNASEIAANTAIEDAANQVGEAAGQVGDAAQDAAESVSDATQETVDEASGE